MFGHENLHMEGLVHPPPTEYPIDVTTMMQHSDHVYPSSKRPSQPSARDCRALELLYGAPQCVFSTDTLPDVSASSMPPQVFAAIGVPGCDVGLFPTGTMPLSAQCGDQFGYAMPALVKPPSWASTAWMQDSAKAAGMGFALGAMDQGLKHTMQHYQISGLTATAVKATAKAGLLYVVSGGAAAVFSLSGDVLSSLTAGTAYQGAVQHVTTGISVVIALATDGVSGLGNVALCFAAGVGGNALGTAAIDHAARLITPD